MISKLVFSLGLLVTQPALRAHSIQSFGCRGRVGSRRSFIHLVQRSLSSSSSSSSEFNMDLLLPHTNDKYDGVIIDSAHLPNEKDEFVSRLKQSLSHWAENRRRGVWLKLSLQQAAFVPIAAELGFVYHHAEKDYVMMTHWLAEGEDRLPANASHQVGVGSVVTRSDGKILLVQERSGPLRGKGVWKIPTGLVDAGEDLSVAAVREVKEETGVDCTFQRVICFRQSHHILFGKSDLFFVCLMKCESEDIVHQEAELVAADWHDISVLTSQSFFLTSPIHALMYQVIENEVLKKESDESVHMVNATLPVGFRPGVQTLYYLSSHQPTAPKESQQEF